MATFTENFFSIVFLGQMNPSILNHDFLVENEIIPKTSPPFSLLLENPPGEQFSEFISTPVMASIKYDRYSILVESQRLQALDGAGNKLLDSALPEIVRKYFSVLKHTPVRTGGLNFKGDLKFDSLKDERQLDIALGINHDRICKLTNSDSSRVQEHIRWHFESGVALLQIFKAKGDDLNGSVQFNFEFEYKGNVDAFLDNLELIEKCHDEFMRILSDLGVQ